MRTHPRSRTGRRTSATTVLAASHVGVDLTIGAFAGLLPSLRDDLEITNGHVAAVATILAAVSSFGQPIAGVIIDRLGPRRLAIGSAASTTLVLASAVLVPSFSMLIAVAMLGGAAAAVYHPSAAALVRTGSGDRSAASALGLFAAGETLGLAIGPVLATAMPDGSTVATSAILASPGVLLAVVVARIPALHRARTPDVESPKPSGAAGSSHGRTTALIATTTAVYLASVTTSTAVPLWLADLDLDDVIGPTLGVFSLAAAVGGVAGGRLSSTRSPSVTAYPMFAAPLAFVAVAHTGPGTAGWYAAVAAAGALGHVIVPVALDLAQQQLRGAVATASGLVMGLPIGLASVAFFILSVSLTHMRIEQITSVAVVSTALAAGIARLALAPDTPTSHRPLPICTCTSGGLAIAAC